MKITTWNVSGLQSMVLRYRNLEDMLEKTGSDIICIQETKMTKEKISADFAVIPSYYAFYNCAKDRTGYSGVATFCKKSTATPFNVRKGFVIEDYRDMDFEGRCLVTDHSDFILFNIYFPMHGGPDRLTYKIWFMRVLQENIEYLHTQGKSIVLAGDFNIAHKEMDHSHPDESNIENGLDHFSFHRGRMWISEMIATQRYVDAFRAFNPDTRAYTCYTADGWTSRTDYFLVSKKFIDQGGVDD